MWGGMDIQLCTFTTSKLQTEKWSASCTSQFVTRSHWYLPDRNLMISTNGLNTEERKLLPIPRNNLFSPRSFIQYTSYLQYHLGHPNIWTLWVSIFNCIPALQYQISSPGNDIQMELISCTCSHWLQYVQQRQQAYHSSYLQFVNSLTYTHYTLSNIPYASYMHNTLYP